MKPAKKILASALAAALLASVAAPAGATTFAALQKRVAKYASDVNGPYRTPCVCLNAGDAYGRAGALRSSVAFTNPVTRQVKVWCEAVTFSTADGGPLVRTTCDDYTLLAK